MKFRTRIVRWNVRSLVSLSDQNAQLRSVFDTMKSRNIDLLIYLCPVGLLVEQQTSVALPSFTLVCYPFTPMMLESSSVLGLRLLGMLLGVSFNLCLNVYSESALNAILPTCLSFLFMLPLILPILLPNLLVSPMLSMTNHNHTFF